MPYRKADRSRKRWHPTVKPVLVIASLALLITILISIICLFDYYYVSKRTREDLGDELHAGVSIQKIMGLEMNSTSNASSSSINATINIDHERRKSYKWSHCGQTHVRPSVNTDLLQAHKISKRIVGGEDAVEHSWPFLASIRIKVNKSMHHCGGSLITDEYVLTAAHCIFPYLKLAFDYKMTMTQMFSLIEVHVGINEHEQEPTRLTSDQVYQVDHFDFHDDFTFNDWVLANDIAILKLTRRVNLNRPEVNVVCLPTNKSLHRMNNGEKIVAIGWGSYSDEYDYTAFIRNHLQQGVFTVKDSNDTMCNQGMIGSRWDKVNTICAYGGDKKMVTCFGDSGGPVLAYRYDRWTLVGIISFAHDIKDYNTHRKKCNKLLPFYFVRVRSYYNWIDKKTNFTLEQFQ